MLAISIEYCAVWNYTARATGLAAELLGEYESQIANLSLVPSRGGVFEVTIDGELVFSKKALGRHALPEEIRQLIQARVQQGE